MFSYFAIVVFLCFTSPKISEVPILTMFYPRSFVPPVRDEEHEIQRKAHAKRVRETRRSTQVTLYFATQFSFARN